VYLGVREFNIFIETNDTTTENTKGKNEIILMSITTERREKLHVYISEIYIRNSNHRDYQSRADSVRYKQGRIKEEEKKKVDHSEKDI
jgi:hypothetical protein